MEFLPSLQGGMDDLKPSLFELLSEQQLSSLLPPSIRYLLAVATHRYPRYLLRALNSFDELYALLSILVERHYLQTYGGGFTENFYGLKRERVLRIKGGEVRRAQIGSPSEVREALKLRTADIWKNLAVMVGLPYIRSKLDQSYEVHAAPSATLLFSSGPQYNRDVLPPDATLKQRFMHYYKWFLRNVYPSINAAYYFSLLAFNLAYLFDNTKYSSPFLWLIGTRIRRLGEADYRAIAVTTNSPSSPSNTSSPNRPSVSNSIFHPRTVYPHLLSSLRFLLPTSIFALKFLEWWHASDFSRQLTRKAAEGVDLPPPIVSGLPSSSSSSPPSRSGLDEKTSPKSNQSKPKKSKKPKPPISSTSYLPIFTVPMPTYAQSSSSLCPICLHSLTNPAAVQTGYVFDYVCIFKWVEGTHERQERFMSGDDEAVWADDDDSEDEEEGAGEKKRGRTGGNESPRGGGSREGKWESGKGRCAVTGKRVLGGTEGIRRVMV